MGLEFALNIVIINVVKSYCPGYMLTSASLKILAESVESSVLRPQIDNRNLWSPSPTDASSRIDDSDRRP